jgi:hypothetical protein
MESPFIFVQGLPELQGLDAQRWLMRANELALDFSREVNGDDAQSHATDAIVIHVAATHLWLATGGKPCWSKLDVEGFVRRFSELPLWECYEANAIVGLLAFYCFLVKHRLVTPRQVDGISRTLERLAAPYVRQLFETYGPGIAGFAPPPYLLN